MRRANDSKLETSAHPANIYYDVKSKMLNFIQLFAQNSEKELSSVNKPQSKPQLYHFSKKAC